MPGFLLHLNAQVQCPHGGQATPMAPNPRVTVGGMAITTMPRQYAIAGCPGVPLSMPPCVTANWITSALRVQAGGEPVLLLDSQALTNNALPLMVLSTQTRAQGI